MKVRINLLSLWWSVFYIFLAIYPCFSHSLDDQDPEESLYASIESAPLNRNEKQLSDLLLSTHYKHITNINNYFVSEKLDGVQGVWTGKQLMTRRGNLIVTPDWFIADFPNYPLIGELWLGRQRFEAISSLVRLKKLNEESNERWKQVKFMVFELPEHKGSFKQRYRFLTENIPEQSLYIKVVSQSRVTSIAQLDNELNRVISLGGEGLMLHKQEAFYPSVGSQDIVKLKPYYDDEAYVVGYKPGKGKFAGMMGALIVETQAGVRFSLGSGFTLAQRQSPPAVNSVVTFKFFGLTKKGTPRFASFLRVRFPPSSAGNIAN